MLNKLFPALVLLLLVTGCSMIPQYQQPKLPVADSWPMGEAYPETEKGMAADIAWQDYFQSSTLKTLISQALENNRDLRVAVLNIEKAQAAYRIQRSDSLPTITANGSASRAGVPDDVSATGKSYTANTFKANLAMTAYELDFFGRVKSLNQQALETYLATEEAMTGTRISLIAETANAYLSYLADRKLLQLARDTASTQQETYEVVKRQFDVGSANQLDVAQASTAVESARVSIAQYTRLVAQDKNALALLVGGSVDEVLNCDETIDNVLFMAELPAGLPSQVLLARPDIQRAEHVLKAANADIGAARAALYPTISLTGSFGLASDSLDGLFQSGARYAWNFTPSLTIPIFNRGRLKASLDVAQVNEQIAATQYEQAVQVAFREVADQLAARGTYQSQLDAQNALVEATGQAYKLSTARYDSGIDNFLTVLDSQRSLFAAQQGAVNVKKAFMVNLVNLYKVLGGGRL
ncbi:efflux transporter outer membrane subunit [Pelobacter seleniigenes]|uniref:efflux transporter outer membrane subunit n=1 Tax=Pelobacter seleniigenes TaxID=407188 RepID=UPI0004A7291A|nr:efflux transporter outer membrane subunit [Pelobacter seleniigenes]